MSSVEAHYPELECVLPPRVGAAVQKCLRDGKMATKARNDKRRDLEESMFQSGWKDVHVGSGRHQLLRDAHVASEDGK